MRSNLTLDCECKNRAVAGRKYPTYAPASVELELGSNITLLRTVMYYHCLRYLFPDHLCSINSACPLLCSVVLFRLCKYLRTLAWFHCYTKSLSLSHTHTHHEGPPFDLYPIFLRPPALFGIIGGIAGALFLYAIVYWSVCCCVTACCLRRRCRTSSPIDPADSYSPNEGGSVQCNLDAIYSPAFGVSGQHGTAQHGEKC